jgi:hypothetical protein
VGDVNQLIFARRHAHEFTGPFLEVGSRNYGNTQDFRSLLASKGRYIGADLQPGPGVDMVADFTADFAAIDAALGGLRFGTILCLSVLEHCKQPFVMADHLTRLLNPGGKIYVSVPFAFKFHGFPSDYWRFTHEGVRLLFPRLVFDMEQGVSVTSLTNDFGPLDDRIGRIDFGSKSHWRRGLILQGLSAKAIQILGRLGLLAWLAGYRTVLAPTQVFMIGTVRGPDTPC